MKRSHIILAAIGIFLTFTLLYNFSSSEGTYEEQIEDARADQVYFYKSSGKSPFKGTKLPVKLKFFRIDVKYRVKASVDLFEDGTLISLQTTGKTTRTYKKYCTLTFDLNGSSQTLTVYQNEEDASDLLLPFTDLTSGKETYGSGRSIPLNKKPSEGDDFILDFNLAKNPYCAYNHEYSCPLPPDENHLDIPIQAGEKTY